jgi:hypothetical protein
MSSPAVLIGLELRVCSFSRPRLRQWNTIKNHKAHFSGGEQGCQMKYFNTKNAILGIFWRALEWKMLIYFMAIGRFNGHLVHFPHFGILYQEKYGNPGGKP